MQLRQGPLVKLVLETTKEGEKKRQRDADKLRKQQEEKVHANAYVLSRQSTHHSKRLLDRPQAPLMRDLAPQHSACQTGLSS